MLDRYSQEEMQQILQTASLLQQQEVVTREQLKEIAAGVGISPDVLQQAQQEWLLKKQTEQHAAIRRSRLRLGFHCHVIPYISVSTFLVLLNLVTTPRCLWSVYPILGWGLGVALHGSCVYRNDKKPQKLFAA